MSLPTAGDALKISSLSVGALEDHFWMHYIKGMGRVTVALTCAHQLMICFPVNAGESFADIPIEGFHAVACRRPTGVGFDIMSSSLANGSSSGMVLSFSQTSGCNMYAWLRYKCRGSSPQGWQSQSCSVPLTLPIFETFFLDPLKKSP